MNTVHRAWFESAIKHLRAFQEEVGSITDLAACLVSAIKSIQFLSDEAIRPWDRHALASLHSALNDTRPSELSFGMIQATIDELTLIERRMGEGGLTQAEALDLDMRLLHQHRFPMVRSLSSSSAQA